jgi:transglycosylase-like protein with SLT domain
VRSPGLILALMGSLVGVVTNALVDATASMAVEPVSIEASTDPLAASSEARTALLVPAGHPLLEARFVGMEDELLSSPMLWHPGFQAEVKRWVHFWETAPRQWFPTYLERMTWFEGMVDATLAEKKVPWSLRYLPVIESGYSPSAVSSAKAVGLWQFMAPTARDFGIEVTRYVDDRRDPFESTAAAAEFLVDLREEFGSWFLALAAYNAGPQRVRQILRRYAPNEEGSDGLYWAVRQFLPKETREYLPNLIAAIIVASDPGAHGYEVPEPRPFAFDRVPVLGQVSFDAVARATGASREEIARLNPEYLEGVTPREREVDVRVPVGTAPSFRAYFSGPTLSRLVRSPSTSIPHRFRP